MLDTVLGQYQVDPVSTALASVGLHYRVQSCCQIIDCAMTNILHVQPIKIHRSALSLISFVTSTLAHLVLRPLMYTNQLFHDQVILLSSYPQG